VVLASFKNEPSFQVAGSFDPQRYQILTRNMGFSSVQDFENEMRINIMIDALQKGVMESVRVSDDEVREAFNREYEQRVLSAIIIDPNSLLNSVKVDESSARAWYEAHKSDYMSPVRIKLNAVEIDPADTDITVDESDLLKAYEENMADYTQEEQRKASHILARV